MVNLENYEKVNLLGNVNNDKSKLLFANEKNAYLKETSSKTIEDIKNPYTELYFWCKGELYDLNSLQTVI